MTTPSDRGQDDSVDHRLHPLLAQRFSPLAFDPDHVVDRADADLMIEAARWAPSAGNSQPWSFIVGLRGDPVHTRLRRHLMRSAAPWASSAGMLVVNLCHRYVEDTDWDYSEFSLYDLGQAVAHLTIQGRALGLQARQFRAFDRAGIEKDFEVPEHWEASTMVALGRAVDPDGPATLLRTEHGRVRRSRDEIRWRAP